MANKEEMEEVSLEELLYDIDGKEDKAALFERDETGRWVHNPSFTTSPRTGRLTYASPPTEGTSFVYSTGTHTWIEKPIT